MHHCLEVQELIALICALVPDGDIPTTTDHRTLVTLARTCRKFKNPALDVLWRTQTSLAPIVNLFLAEGKGKTVRFTTGVNLGCFSLTLSNLLRYLWLRRNGLPSSHTLHVSKC